MASVEVKRSWTYVKQNIYHLLYNEKLNHLTVILQNISLLKEGKQPLSMESATMYL